MLFNLLVPFIGEFGPLNLFRYLTFRTGGAVITALFIAFLVGPPMIDWLRMKQSEGQPIRLDGPEGHLLTKKGTPTMGGFLILLALTGSTMLWADLTSGYIWIVLVVTIGFGLIGFLDDFLKVTKRNSRGLPSRMKLIAQIVIGAIAGVWIVYLTRDPLSTGLAVPVFKSVLLDLGWFFIPFAVVVIVGASNAVNLTDGLDGLAIVPVMIAAACFALIAYLVGNVGFANYVQINPLPGTGEIAGVCGALCGCG